MDSGGVVKVLEIHRHHANRRSRNLNKPNVKNTMEIQSRKKSTVGTKLRVRSGKICVFGRVCT